MIQTIEEVALNAWPPLNQILFDGWVLRFANGYTGRANSVNVLQPSQLDIPQKIAQCIELYQQNNLPPVFRLTPLAQPDNLDDYLDSAGFKRVKSTSVQVLDLTKSTPTGTANFEYWPHYDDEWEAHFVALNGVPAQRATHQVMLQRIIPKCCFAVLYHQGVIVACGLAVFERGCVGLFDIVTAKAVRRQGFGTTLIESILAWAKKQGATTAYLQVEKGNSPALELYHKLGFRELYEYWYRVRG